jgi:putative ABC transport system ATP-binding protein
MATITPSKILLLDEHTAALDPKMANLVLDLTNKIIADNKLTALMITHSMSQALEYGTRTIMMYHGKITQDMETSQRHAMNPADLLAFFDL